MGTPVTNAKNERRTSRCGPAGVHVLSRGLSILSQFTAEEPALTLTDLSRKTGLHRATVYRFAKTLESDGYLAYDSESALYSIGQAWAAALYTLGGTGPLKEILNRDLIALAETTGETAALSVRRGQQVQVINVAPVSHFFAARLPESALVPLSENWSVHARIHLAFSGDSMPVGVRAARTAADGIAYSREEYRAGLCAAAVPVFSRGRLVATVGLVIPVERFDDANVERFSQELRTAAATMGRRLDQDHEQGNDAVRHTQHPRT